MKKLKYSLVYFLIVYSCITGCNSKTKKSPYNNSLRPSARDTIVNTKRNKNQIISMIIKLEKPVDTFSINVAHLKYNKAFAFSFTLDDGLISDYLVAYPFFSGGKVSGPYYYFWKDDYGGDGSNYPGLFYTDGFGNKQPFRAGIAINAKSISILGVILPHSHLTWKQVKVLYNAGWDVLNHSYNHATGKNVHAKYEVEKNDNEVNKHVGFQMKDFVIPGGPGDSVSNELYTKAAFASGMETVQCEDFGNYLVKIDSTLNLNQLRLGRLFMYSVIDTIDGKVQSFLQLRSGHNSDFNKSPIQNETVLFNRIDTLIHLKKNFWINAFTHSVGNQDLWNISLIFPEFKSFFDQLEFRYGQQGADDIWMAPTQEVYDYLLNKRDLRYKSNLEGNTIIISIDKNSLPGNLRYHELTFLFNKGNNVQSVKCDGCDIESQGNDKNQYMINITWF